MIARVYHCFLGRLKPMYKSEKYLFYNPIIRLVGKDRKEMNTHFHHNGYYYKTGLPMQSP